MTSLKKSLLAIVKGFSIPVFLNGEELERPHAIAHLPTTCDIGCGVAYIPGLAKPNSDIDFRSVIYFQGLPVSCPDLGTAWQFAKVNIVHIDNTFSVRMPDRDSFIDPVETAERIKSALKQAILNTLNNIKATRPVTEFVEYFKALCLVDAQYLLNDVDLLPTEVIETMDHIPDRHNSFQTSFVDEPIHKNKLVGNQQLLIANLDNYHHSEIDNYFALSSLLFWEDALLIKTRDLHKDHWVHGMTKDPKAAKLDVVYEASSSEHFSFRFVCGNLHLVPGFTVNAWGHSYHITNESITLEDGNIICGNDFPSDALLQLDSYETDEVFNEQVHDDDTSSLSHLLFSMRGEKPEVSVQRALQSERIPSMTGCQNTATCVVIAEKKLQVTPLLDILKAFSASLSLPVDVHQMQDFIASLNLAVSQHV
ncbi:hypothetical protein [Undibacterium oligocarboniphilum]|uniref:Uncharacterized protein n=1 Tax=Undibacterium oligocarboniphilum TaxID=666702 RepID=A0A850QJX8_9BURK|nr:hypothetical protein [Undibacterium oligocarboniphilum]MBC3871866.1 hypothetical protein [Undibacterium oligocarboniphilum]NVO79427.1 hypothetical protein [Undibacterium oligocarboniphilum]